MCGWALRTFDTRRDEKTISKRFVVWQKVPLVLQGTDTSTTYCPVVPLFRAKMLAGKSLESGNFGYQLLLLRRTITRATTRCWRDSMYVVAIVFVSSKNAHARRPDVCPGHTICCEILAPAREKAWVPESESFQPICRA